MATETFSKRVYSPTSLLRDLRVIINHMDELRQARRSRRISPAFAEKIMLAVTQVNGCRYCSYGHSKAALAAGVSQRELAKLLKGELDEFPEDESVALTFAQHYAESCCQPDPIALQRLQETYGDKTAKDILAYIRMITFGNLYGNTFDAFLSRLRFRPAAGSSFTGELFVLFGSLVIMPLGMIGRHIFPDQAEA